MNLLEYEFVPIKYEMRATPASLQIRQELPSVKVSKTGGTFDIRQQQVQVRLDTFERRSSMGLKGMPDFMRDIAQRGKNAAMEATRDYAQTGDSLKNIQKGANIPDIMFSKMMQRSQGDLVLIPLSSTDISWQPGGVQMQYNQVQQNFDWETHQTGPSVEFVPGSVSMNILQYPEVRFRYVGPPIYVPPSSAPDAPKPESV